MDKIKVGVIGCGGIFRNLHSPYYEEPNRRSDIVAVADLDADSANEQAKRFNARAYTGYRQLLDQADVDAIDVCCHPAPHLEITLAAAAAGKHVLMEKPMCRNVDEGNQMVAAAEKANILLQVAYMMRFDPGQAKLKELLDDGTLGTLQMAYSNQIGWFRHSTLGFSFSRNRVACWLNKQFIILISGCGFMVRQHRFMGIPVMFRSVGHIRYQNKLSRITLQPSYISKMVVSV